jgi:hypothetical protein
MKPNTLKQLVSDWFASAGKLYGDQPYEVHNQEVREVLRRFGFGESERVDGMPHTYEYLHLAAELHDVFEDLKETITPGFVIALGVNLSAIGIALLVTDEPGKNRAERKKKTYENIKFCDHALIIKLADRIANVERGAKNDMYRNEHTLFKQTLCKEFTHEMPYQEAKIFMMWKHLDEILEPQPA